MRIVIKPPQKLGYANLIVCALIPVSEVLDVEPRYYKEVTRIRDKTKWLRAVDDKMKTLNDNNTWDMIKRPIRQD